MVAPAKIKVSQRQRLPPTILSYTQTNTKNPLPKQIIVEPQTKTNNPVEQINIVQESRKRKGEELPHLFKRTRPTQGWRTTTAGKPTSQKHSSLVMYISSARSNQLSLQKSPSNFKVLPSLQELTSTQPGRPSRVERTTARDDNAAGTPRIPSQIANNREHFVNYVLMEPHDIHMGDNSPIQAVGIGTTYTVIPSDGSFAKMELRNVLHVPRLRKNLVSRLCLHHNGWGMSHPEEDEMVLSNSKQGDSFKIITKNEQLPLIPLEVRHPLLGNFMQVGGGSNLLKLHQVLGHICLDRIKQYTEAMGIKVPQGITLPTCHSCMCGKQHRVPVSKGPAQHSGIPMEVIHLDLCLLNFTSIG